MTDFGTQTQTTTIPGAGQQETQIRRLLEQLAQSGALQLGDLSGLAQGQVQGPTGSDRELIAQSIQQASQLAQEQMRQSGAVQQAQLRESISSRTGQGSGGEVAANLLQSLGTQGGINQSILQAQQSGGQALLNLPFMRGTQQLQANQALFQRIIGSASPVLAAGLQERISQPTTTQEDPLAFFKLLSSAGQSAAGLGFKPFGSDSGAAALAGG